MYLLHKVPAFAEKNTDGARNTCNTSDGLEFFFWDIEQGLVAMEICCEGGSHRGAKHFPREQF